MESLKELLMPKSFNRFSYMAVLLWIACGVILLGSFAEMEKSDFHCTVKLEKKSLVQGKCSEQYNKRFNNLGIPVYAFVIINFALILTVCAIYSQFIKPTVEAISNKDAERLLRPQTPPRRLFMAYCCQLIVRFALGILFIILATQLLPNVPSNYDCDLTQESNPAANASSMSNIQNRTIYECRNEGAAKKTFWTKALTVVNAVFVLIILIEIIWILLRVKKVGKKFLEDSRFLAEHINSTHQDVHPFIEKLKTDIIKEVKNLEALTLTKPGEPVRGGEWKKDLNLEQIYVKLVAQEDRQIQKHDFAEDREQQLKVYPKPSENAKIFEGPEDFIDSENKKILAVGRPGIGKTLFCTKFLLDWASGKVFKETQDTKIQYDVAFLVKFRKFNSVENLSLRELLTRSLRAENYLQSQTLPNEVWCHIHENPDKVLILLDGFDEYKARKDIRSNNNETENNSEQIPLPALFFKIMTGNLLPGATIVTTTRPTAVSSITSIKFDKTIEILGFTEDRVEQYVKNFTENENSEGAGERILEHIKNNMNLFSLCYIPVNCFIICSCLVYFVKSSGELPAKVTDIYNFAMKLFFFRHNEQYKDNPPSHEDIMSGTLPPEAEEQFKRLGEIAFNGLDKGTLIFRKSQVRGLENSELFHQMPDDTSNPFKHEAQFCFIHLTMQEFLAARHIVDTMNEEEMRRFVSDNIKKGEWHVVMQFVSGLLGERKLPIEIFTAMLPVKTVKRGRFTWWPTGSDKHLSLTIMKCLYEHEDNELASCNSGVQNKLEEIGVNALDFSSCALAPSDCTAVVHALKNVPQISYIYLPGNQIGSLGCVEIRKLLDNGNCQITTLELSGNNIDDNGVLELCKGINTNSKLTVLNLSNNKITDKGVDNLCDVLTNPNCKLTVLYLVGNKAITAEARQRITHANPKVRF